MEKFIYFFTGITAFTTVAIWLGKLIITKTFDLGLEKYKSSLQKDIEIHKSELAKQSLEHEVKFSKLHNDRAEKIIVLYKKVVELEKALIHSTNIAQGAEFKRDTQREKECINTIETLIAQLEFDKIFFTKETVSKVEDIIREAWQIVVQMTLVRSKANRETYFSRETENYVNYGELWNKTFERTQVEFKKLKETLADDFRELIGI
ncbi:hypothetical protein [Flavobacterium sp. 25HG05S-40]|uniref:hypothetical protein n=1 Tax=Flavobacterium sp. 25HG05S-40 TaxID=3458682 RepID=UPI004043DAAA